MIIDATFVIGVHLTTTHSEAVLSVLFGRDVFRDNNERLWNK